MEKQNGDWRTILQAVGGVGGALLAFALAVLMAAYAGFSSLPGRFHSDAVTNLQAIITASGIALAGAVLLIAGTYSIQRLRGREIPLADLQPPKIWQGVALFVLWVGAAGLAEVFFNNDTLRWFTPPLYLLAIGTPVYFLIRLGTGGLLRGSRQRLWGAFSTGMALGTSIAILAEGGLAILGLLGVGLYYGFHPNQLAQLQNLANQLTNTPNLDQLLTTFSDLLTNPLTILIALLFFSGFTPFIEETAKSITAWILFDHLDSPAQGFAIGALSGAGFALLESLLASASPDPSWAVTLLVRGGSTMMHIMAAGITGWGIASFRAHRQARYLFGTYALAMFLHSLWNACVVLVVTGSAHTMVPSGTPDAFGVMLIGLGVAILVTLALAIPIVLGTVNWRLRTSLASTQPSTNSDEPSVANFPFHPATEEEKRGQEEER